MSDPGDIPLPAAGRPNLVEALSIARDLPVDALLLAADAPDRIAPAVLRVVERAAAGEALADRDANLLFWGIHVLAEVRDVRLCGPLLRLLRRPDEELEAVLSDALTETVARIVVGVFDGEVPPLREALLDPATPGMARWQLFLALAYLASTGRVGRDEAHAILLAFDVDRPGGSSDDGWYGWEDAIALCGFADLAPRVAAARADARLLDEVGMSPEEFASTLEAAAASPDDPARFAASGVGEFGTAADELDAMLAALADDEDGADAPEPVRNPLRDLGRNDPCPCGSGKKFKRCCLAA